MKKRSHVLFVLSLFAFVLCSTALFAENSPEKVLVAADVDAFVANFDELNADLETLGDKYNNLFESSESDSPTDIMTKIRSVKVPVEIQSILRKHGLGENGFEKVMIITIGFAALEMESILKTQQGGEDNSVEAKANIDKSIADVSKLKAAINSDDLALIASKRDTLYPVLSKQYDDSSADDETNTDAAYADDPYSDTNYSDNADSDQ